MRRQLQGLAHDHKQGYMHYSGRHLRLSSLYTCVMLQAVQDKRNALAQVTAVLQDKVKSASAAQAGSSGSGS